MQAGRSSLQTDLRLISTVANMCRHATCRSGASLLELLSVSALIVLMAGLLYSSIGSFSSSAGRRGAVNMLMNAFEHARIAALESGQTVHVGFADKDFPIEEMRYKAFLVFRETSDEERAAGAQGLSGSQEMDETARQCRSKEGRPTVWFQNPAAERFLGLNEVLPNSQSDETFPCLSFNSSGAVSGASNPIELFLYEGYFSGDQDIQTRRSEQAFRKDQPFALYRARSIQCYHHRPSMRSRLTGFSLVEAALSLAILSFAIVAIIGLASRGSADGQGEQCRDTRDVDRKADCRRDPIASGHEHQLGSSAPR